MLLIQLGHHVFIFCSLVRDGCQLELRLSLSEPDVGSVGPEGPQAYSESVTSGLGVSLAGSIVLKSRQ